MKKLTIAVLTLAMLLSLTACGDAISKLLYKSDSSGSSDGVQAQEPDIPGTTAGDTSASPAEPFDPVDPTAPAEPDASQTEPDSAPEPTVKDEAQTSGGVTASHSDVTLFSAGESFTLSVQGMSGVYACSFVSADPEVAAVDELTGAVTAAAPGVTTVTMHVEGAEGQYDFDCIIRCRWSEAEPDLPGADTETSSGTAASSASLSGFFTTLQGKYEGLGSMMVLDTQLLDSYYPGLTGIAAVEEVLIQETAMSTANMAVGLVRLSDSATTEDVLAVQSVLQSRITAQADGGAFYPESCETWENGVITSVSNCVGMFVYPDGAYSMANLFTETFSN